MLSPALKEKTSKEADLSADEHNTTTVDLSSSVELNGHDASGGSDACDGIALSLICFESVSLTCV